MRLRGAGPGLRVSHGLPAGRRKGGRTARLPAGKDLGAALGLRLQRHRGKGLAKCKALHWASAPRQAGGGGQSQVSAPLLFFNRATIKNALHKLLMNYVRNKGNKYSNY